MTQLFMSSLQLNMVFMSSPFAPKDLSSNTKGLLHYDQTLIIKNSIRVSPAKPSWLYHLSQTNLNNCKPFNEPNHLRCSTRLDDASLF